jgi:hypothetical protein
MNLTVKPKSGTITTDLSLWFVHHRKSTLNILRLRRQAVFLVVVLAATVAVLFYLWL